MGEIKATLPEYERLLTDFITARNAAGLSQKKLADKININQSIVGRIENKTSVPSVETFLKILSGMGKTLAIVDMQDKSE